MSNQQLKKESSPFLMMLKTYWSHPLILFCWALGLSLAFYTYNQGLIFEYYFYLPIPVLIMPFYEWLAHKYLLHAKVEVHKNPKLYKYMLRLHYRHHHDPHSLPDIFAPLSSTVFVFVKFFLLFWIVSQNWEIALVLEVVVVFLYNFYEWTHLGHHMPGYDHLTPFGKIMKKKHMFHHYHNEGYWWGITTNIGDLVLGSHPDPKTIQRSTTAQKIEEWVES